MKLINPETKESLFQKGDNLVDNKGGIFPIINKIPRFVEADNYCSNFGFQWNKFPKTQLDDKTIVFSLLKRGNKVYTEVVLDCSAAML